MIRQPHSRTESRCKPRDQYERSSDHECLCHTPGLPGSVHSPCIDEHEAYFPSLTLARPSPLPVLFFGFSLPAPLFTISARPSRIVLRVFSSLPSYPVELKQAPSHRTTSFTLHPHLSGPVVLITVMVSDMGAVHGPSARQYSIDNAASPHHVR